jgi:hypothetical protein
MPILTYDVAAGTVTSLGFQDRLFRLPVKEDDCFLAVGYRPAGGIVDAADAPSLKDVLGRGIGTQQKSYVGLTAEEYRLLSNALQASPPLRPRVDRTAGVTSDLRHANMCSHGIQGSPHARFRRALASGDPLLIRTAAPRSRTSTCRLR